jgi:hypothetical protein
MGVFTEWQPKYAGIAGIATLPVDPETKFWRGPGQKIGLPGSTAFTAQERYQDCNGIGFWCGSKNGITDLDIDTVDEGLLHEAERRHGTSPIVVQTASGKFKIWYRWNGERRSVRKKIRELWGREVPIDLLGSGISVAPPTTNTKGVYRFIRGSLEEVRNLPVMRGVNVRLDALSIPDKITPQIPIPAEKVKAGSRNDTLWRACAVYARTRAENFDDLLAFAKRYHEEHIEMSADFTEMEVIDCARSAWRMEERGENYVGGHGVITCPPDIVDGLAIADPDAFVLLMVARRHHWMKERFCLANGMAETTLNWRMDRFKKARKALEGAGYIVVLRRGGRGPGDPTVYAWKRGRKPRQQLAA